MSKRKKNLQKAQMTANVAVVWACVVSAIVLMGIPDRGNAVQIHVNK